MHLKDNERPDYFNLPTNTSDTEIAHAFTVACMVWMSDLSPKWPSNCHELRTLRRIIIKGDIESLLSKFLCSNELSFP